MWKDILTNNNFLFVGWEVRSLKFSVETAGWEVRFLKFSINLSVLELSICNLINVKTC